MANRTAIAGLRADAAHNRELILAAGREVFLELGADAPLDRIAARAGVGNATLYRHFRTRAELVKHVAIDGLRRVHGQARLAVADPAGPWAGLVAFCHVVVEQRLIATFPVLGPHVEPDHEFGAARDELVTTLRELVTAAQRAGELRGDIAAGDIIMVLATITRPLPGLTAPLTTSAQARHLGIVLAGLHRRGASDLPAAPIVAQDIVASLAAGRRG